MQRVGELKEREIPLSASGAGDACPPGRPSTLRRAAPPASKSNSFFAFLVLAEPVSLTHFFILVRIITSSNIFVNISAKRRLPIVLFIYFCLIRTVIRLWYCDKDALLCFRFLI